MLTDLSSFTDTIIKLYAMRKKESNTQLNISKMAHNCTLLLKFLNATRYNMSLNNTLTYLKVITGDHFYYLWITL